MVGIIQDDINLEVEEIADQIGEWFRQQRNIVRDRVEFHERWQQHGETFNAFFNALNCDQFVTCRDDQFATAIVAGV